MGNERKAEIANEIVKLAKDTIAVHFRFFAAALSRVNLSIDNDTLLQSYLSEPGFAVRLCLHSMFHMLFLHAFTASADDPLCTLACDIAVESAILELEFTEAMLYRDESEKLVIEEIRGAASRLTYGRVLEYLHTANIPDSKIHEWEEIFKIDKHDWPEKLNEMKPEEIILYEEDMKRLAAGIKSEMKNFSEGANRKSLTENLAKAIRERKSYDEILARFATIHEEIKINPDEYDNVYYSYGLRTYGNMPLIEPLEYTEDKRIREFVIALDTSASISDELMREFLIRTYEILIRAGAYSTQVIIHILTCDSQIRSDDTITNREEFDEYIRTFGVKGYGATDFRPVFEYTDEKAATGEYGDVAGIIYFTDGYGVYPAKAPVADAVFAFATDDENRPPVPNWAIEAQVS